MPVDAGAVRRAWHEYSVLINSLVCFLCSFLIFAEALEKAVTGSEDVWSPLGMFGPPVWLPITIKQGYLIAVQVMITSGMYCVACWFLFTAHNERKASLQAPWLIMQFLIVVFQMASMVTFRKIYRNQDLALSTSLIFLNLLLLWSTYVSVAQVTANV